jgi:hypothetical protein
MADLSGESAILAMLQEDDAGGLGYTVATIATKLWGPPRSLLQAKDQHARTEVMIESLVKQGRLQIAGYLYLREGRIPRYKLPDMPPPGGR